MIKNLHWTDICHVAEEYHLYKKIIIEFCTILASFFFFLKSFHPGIVFVFVFLLTLMLVINSILSVFDINKKLLS